jgi:hypothetical protein
MKQRNTIKQVTRALGAAALLWGSSNLQAGGTLPANAAALRANAGTTFVTEFRPSDFLHTVDGVADVSLLGNCRVHFDVVGQFPSSPDQPIPLTGSLTITAADGTTLTAAVEGAVAFGEAGFANFYYHVTFTGGTGRFTTARGRAEIAGVALLTSEAGDRGTATWRMKGHVITPPAKP